MKSLVRPKRIKITATDGVEYSFLCKPEDDLRKDARLMDFFTVINKLLKADTSSRQRKLRMDSLILLALCLSALTLWQVFKRMLSFL